MSLRGLLLVGLAAALTAIANLLLRGGVIRGGGLSFVRADVLGQALSLLGEPMFVAGVVFYGAAAVVWFSVISVEFLAASYSVLVGLTFVLVGLGAVIFYDELISPQKLLGMATILGGIFLIVRA